jgi:hypothetical protein
LGRRCSDVEGRYNLVDFVDLELIEYEEGSRQGAIEDLRSHKWRAKGTISRPAY